MFSKSFKRILFFTFSVSFILLMSFTKNAYAAVDQIVFINQPQTIVVGQSSAQYQIQLQNASGGVEQAPETIYFTLPLGLGSFSSQKGGTPYTASSSVYIATGNSNKYFYFQSNVAGTFSLVISAHNKDNTEVWQTEQTVQVVDSLATSTDNQNSSDTNIATTTATTTEDIDNTASSTGATSNQTNTVVEYISVHSDPEDLSSYQENPVLGLSAGRDRVGYIGVPLVFKASHNFLDGFAGSVSDCTFTWSFGDGLQDIGETVSHLYKYAGDYSVVLNGVCDGINAVSRANVKILSPQVSLDITPAYDIELKNIGDAEINFGSWSLMQASSSFVFPKDTIVGAGKDIILSNQDTKIFIASSSIVFLNNPIGGEVASTSIILADNSAISSSTNITASSSVSVIITEPKPAISQVVLPVAIKKEIMSTSSETAMQDTAQKSAAALVATESSSTESFWSTIIHIPSRTFGNIFHSFYNF